MQQAPAFAGSPAWRRWAMVGLTQDDNQCIHGCYFLPAPNHAVSLFMDALWADACDQKLPFTLMKGTIVNRQVCCDATFRKMAFDVMLATGVNIIIMDADNLGMKVAVYLVLYHLGHTISVLEHYDGDGDYILARWKTMRVVDDLRGGGEREVIRFYLKRLSCTCLKALYSVIKKSQPLNL